LLILAGVGTYLALAKDQHHQAPPKRSEPGAETPVQIRVSPQPVAADVSPIDKSSDPETFATGVATALFEWDTATMTSQTEYVDRLVSVADPTGEESAGLVSDIANYLPTATAWASLREYRTRQWLEITATSVPSVWPQAVAEAGTDGLLPGTTAYTIEGIRHRAGIWEDSPASSAHKVSFTVFLVCAPSYPTCHVLRLSLPEKPLG